MDQAVGVALPTGPDEFLVWEARQELRFEFDGSAPLAINGGTAAHADIERNILVALTVRLGDSGCRAYGGNLKVQVGRA